MEGISKDELIRLQSSIFARDDEECANVKLRMLTIIIDQCRELQEPWMTLDEFLKSGFIGACWVYTDTEFVYTAYYAKDGQFYESDLTECRLDRNTIVRVIPLHKPEQPK